MVVRVFNEMVPASSLYRGRQNGWPMTIDDIMEPSKERIHGDARHMVTIIMLDNVCEDRGVERRKYAKCKVAELMDRGENTVRNSEAVARFLIQHSPDYARAYQRTLNELAEQGFTLVGTSKAV